MSTPTTSTKREPWAREKLITTASELFYEEGVHTVGIDRVIQEAGVAKATLYKHFSSKDELIRAYLLRHHEITRDRMVRELGKRFTTPIDKMVGVFEVLGESFSRPDFHGCAYVNASAEARPGGPVEEASDYARAWVRGLFVDLGREAGLIDPLAIGQQLSLMYDGATVAAKMDRDPTMAIAAQRAARAVLEAAPRAAISPS
ncbi:TetR/AcrR family transcriptional regulator [Herbiconiux sp. P17]|uniref:TetR/AcrR family transcriptional regulator n=1 Tax=Herbiconiux wuyangfengii TaxID=3342794 RepID=UPI0035B9C1B7